MSRYPQVPLGEVLRAAPDEVVVEPDEMYRVAGIYSFGRGLFARPTIQGTDTKYKTLFRLREDQFVYSRLKAFEGAVAIVDGQFDGAFVSQEFPQFNAVRERVDPTFLRWICAWPAFWEKLAHVSEGIGARRERVRTDRLLEVEIPLPPLERQREIADWLDAAVGRLDQTTAQLVEARSAIQRTVDASLRQWQSADVMLADVLSLVRDAIPVEMETTYRTVGVYSFGRGLFSRTPFQGSETSYRTLFRLRRDDFVFSRLFAWEGATAVVSEEFDGLLVSQEFPTLRPNPKLLEPAYMAWICRSTDFLESLGSIMKGLGSRRQRVHTEDLLKLHVPIPSPAEQRTTVRRLDQLERAKTEWGDSIERLRSLRTSYLRSVFG